MNPRRELVYLRRACLGLAPRESYCGLFPSDMEADVPGLARAWHVGPVDILVYVNTLLGQRNAYKLQT